VTFERALAGVLTLLVPAAMLAVVYVFGVYIESRRASAGERLPLLYRLIALQMAIKAVTGLAMAAVLVMFWTGQPVQGGSAVIGISLVVTLITPILVAVVIRHIRRHP
jgi:hypothetical protein